MPGWSQSPSEFIQYSNPLFLSSKRDKRKFFVYINFTARHFIDNEPGFKEGKERGSGEIYPRGRDHVLKKVCCHLSPGTLAILTSAIYDKHPPSVFFERKKRSFLFFFSFWWITIFCLSFPFFSFFFLRNEMINRATRRLDDFWQRQVERALTTKAPSRPARRRQRQRPGAHRSTRKQSLHASTFLCRCWCLLLYRRICRRASRRRVTFILILQNFLTIRGQFDVLLGNLEFWFYVVLDCWGGKWIFDVNDNEFFESCKKVECEVVIRVYNLVLHEGKYWTNKGKTLAFLNVLINCLMGIIILDR